MSVIGGALRHRQLSLFCLGIRWHRSESHGAWQISAAQQAAHKHGAPIRDNAVEMSWTPQRAGASNRSCLWVPQKAITVNDNCKLGPCSAPHSHAWRLNAAWQAAVRTGQRAFQARILAHCQYLWHEVNLGCLRCGSTPQSPLPALRCLSRMLIKSHISRRKAGSTRLSFIRSDSFTGCLRRQEVL